MKKKSPPYAIIVAAILGIVAVAAFFQYEKAHQAAEAAAIKKAQDDAAAAIAAANSKPNVTVTPTSTNMRNVLYATQPIEPGRAISPGFFEKKPTPTDILPDAYTDATDIVGWYASRKIEKGDPLTPRNVSKILPYLTQRISPGMRSITLPVFNTPPVNDTGGFVVDGDKVDLLYTVGPKEGLVVNTQTVMQNVDVLYVPGSPVKTEKTDGVNPIGAALVTFEVTPEQAQALVFMSQIKEGHFSMILRARKDTSEIKIKPFDSRDYDWYDLKKVQKVVDKSQQRVKDLAQQIEAAEKKQGQGTTNETTTPTP